MEHRILGRTGLEVSMLGMGGFHLLEISPADVKTLLHEYMAAGGNYIETAAEYGNGESERKIGLALKERRDDCILATKCHLRERDDAEQFIARSLRNLQTDQIDILFMHHVQTLEELQSLLSADGAIQAAEEARKHGQVRFIGITNHGHPEVLIHALKLYPFDVIMTNINYYDYCAFPEIERDLLPIARKQDVGIVGMKAVADGLLWKSAEIAFRYAWSLPIHTMAAGINTLEMLKQDIAFAEQFTPLSEAERERLFADAPELGTYVCRLCGKCLPCPEGIDIPKLFQLEGWYDRQLWDGVVRDPGDYLMRQILRYWYNNEKRARQAYDEVSVQADACTECRRCEPRCPYHLAIMDKLQRVHYKLTTEPKYMVFR